jgi:phosphatidylglycerophosphatase C
MAFSADKISQIVRPDAMKLIQDYKQVGARVVVVSASPENWVKPWCNIWKVDCVATRLEYRDGKLTGNITGINCYGKEKVERIKRFVKLEEFGVITAYGDSRGDHEMLALAHEPHYRAFNKG